MKIKLEAMWYTILYPVTGIMLLILLFDVYTGKAYIKNGSTLPHHAYILVLPVLIHIMYKILKGDGWKIIMTRRSMTIKEKNYEKRKTNKKAF